MNLRAGISKANESAFFDNLSSSLLRVRSLKETVKMNVPWKLKSLIFGAVDAFSATSVLYFLQKNVTKRSRLTKLDISPNWERHKTYLEKYNAKGFVFEFGAGKSLAQNLYLSSIIDRQLIVDLNPMLDLELVEQARAFLAEKTKLKASTRIEKVADLDNYGLTYKAPFDAASSGLEDESVDACISTNTLEHIPYESIREIFAELHRVLKGSGIVSAKIDYSDHYAHTDNSISLLNYLRFDERTWRKFNHRCHYQNRLRHYEYIELFRSLGFRLVEEKVFFAEENVPAEISRLFEGVDDRWKATSAHIVLRKA